MIFFALCGLEVGIFLALLSLYRAATKPDAWSFLLSSPGIVLFCATLIIVFSIGWTVRILWNGGQKRKVFMEIIMNLVMLVLSVGSAEVLGHLLEKQTASGETVLGVVLYPKHWSKFASYHQKVIDRMAQEGSHNTFDQVLGWNLTPSHADITGEYLSSAEGLRAPRVGMTFADTHTRHSGTANKPATIRIALVGDSFTYGAEVRCENTWGHSLEGLLQAHNVQVLNFGIGAYGLNQTLLRYEKDARPWKPHIVIVGLNNVMITRINNIYPLFKDPEWGFPLARPRLIERNDTLIAINTPITAPKEIFTHAAVSDLPYLHLDDYYRPFEWERGGFWTPLEKSYLFRLAYSFRPPSDGRQEERNQKASSLAKHVIQHLVRDVSDDRAVPLVVYFPSKEDLTKFAETGKPSYVPLPVRVLENAGIDYFDATPCLAGLNISDVFMEHSHYTPEANEQIARCLEPVLLKMVTKLNK